MKGSRLRVGLSMGVLGLTVVALWGCPTTTPEEPYVAVTASPKTIPADGTTTDITVSAAEFDGKAGSGLVTFSVKAGSLGEEGITQATAELSNGKTSIKYWCKLSENADCTGTKRISVSWKTAAGSISVTLGNPIGADAEAAGPDAEPAGEDAGVAGRDAAAPGDDAAITEGLSFAVAANPTGLYLGVGESAEIKAVLMKNDAGFAGQTIKFETDKGGLFNAADGISTATTPLTVTTSADGTAIARFTGDFPTLAEAGEAIIKATHLESDAKVETKVTILSVGNITFQGLNCPTSGTACTLMGLKGSRWNEWADVSFKVTSVDNKPIKGMLVDFAFDNADFPPDATITQSAVTDASGIATARVTAGQTIGVVTVKATVVPMNPKVAVSTPIGIRAALASNRNLMFNCSPKNIPVLVAVQPPAEITVTCSVRLYDRFNNPIGTGASVYFKTEAGGIPNVIKTKAFDPAGDNSAEGSGSVTFNSNGTFPPADVLPLTANASQWPYALEDEPVNDTGTLKLNPRDMFVTVVAYTDGEEFWDDKNGNGQWDSGETFIDQSEPFVDVNDNGAFDSADQAIGLYKAANGTRDSAAKIWAETRILYSGRPKSSTATMRPFLKPNPYPNVPRGGAQPVQFWFPDAYGNRMTSIGTSFSAFLTPTGKGNITLDTTSLLDAYGFGYERRLVSAADETDCVYGTTPLCKWKVLFSNWSNGFAGTGTINGDSLNSSLPPTTVTATVRAILQGVGVDTTASGIIE
ncbi:MAG: hypothetical protein QM765_21875 [Myxococcales bacterium]